MLRGHDTSAQLLLQTKVSPSLVRAAMPTRQVMTTEKVIEELDRSDSEDDFDGYLDEGET